MAGLSHTYLLPCAHAVNRETEVKGIKEWMGMVKAVQERFEEFSLTRAAAVEDTVEPAAPGGDRSGELLCELT